MSEAHTPLAFVVAAPSSGCGKTTVVMGLIAALRRRGLSVQPFKCGPDYIDAAYHSKLAGRTCINLDVWMTSESYVRETFMRHAAGADVVIVEGVMGLFDGADGGKGSAAHVARLLDLPVLHVIDASKAAHSAAAMLYGMEQFDSELCSLGAVFNQIASCNHWQCVASFAQDRCTSKLLGYLPKDKALILPERQLGLLSVHESGLPGESVDSLVDAIEAHIDLDALLESPRMELESVPVLCDSPAQVRLGVASDAAFCFYYQDNFELLRQAGIELVLFSPLEESALPDNLDGLYFGGGFPEEFVSKLASNTSMLQSVRDFAGPVFAECGGLIYLSQQFKTLDGECYDLVGRVAGRLKMCEQLQACGYREVVTSRETWLGPKGTRLRGHEFHWSCWDNKPNQNFGVFDSTVWGKDVSWGYADSNIVASYFHVHFGSCLDVVAAFYAAMKSTRDTRLEGETE